jgi:RNA polymerase II subunit A small phosphatase-like protein
MLQGSYVKDLSLLDRDLNHCVIIDNSPLSYMFHPKNAIGCGTFIDDLRDRELPVIADFLREIEHAKDVREHMLRYPDYLIQSGAFAS